jgi:hypothetical protein
VVNVPEPRMVRCQYSRDPHPLDDECVNVTEAWPVGWSDEVLEAGLGRVLAAINGLPPKVEARPGVPTRWRDVPCGAIVLYGIPREVLVNDPWQAKRTVMLAGIPAIYPRADETVLVVDDAMPCCDLHSQTCGPGALCCRDYVEAAHPYHTDGSNCVIGRDR